MRSARFLLEFAPAKESWFSLRDSAKPCVVEGNLEETSTQAGISGLENRVRKSARA